MITIKAHVAAAVAACCVLVAGLFGLDSWQRTSNNPDTFMTVYVSVPDHKSGDDPDVIYTREIYREMRGFWTVEIRRIDSPGDQCHGNGAALYSPKEQRSFTMKLSKYSGNTCILEPGQYIMVTRWDLTDDMGKSAVVINATKPFTVSRLGS